MSTQTINGTQTNLAALRTPQERVENMPAVRAGFSDLQSFELLQRQAKLFASSSLVPKEYQGNISNCVIALDIANRIGAGALQVMQNLVIVHGRPTWSSQFLISTANQCGRFTAIRFEFFGEPTKDSWGCRAWAIEKSTGEKLVGTDVTIEMAKAEGWYGKNGSKWKTMPQQMLMYRAASWWTRVYAPELSMGLHTKEEMSDVWDAEKLDDGSFAVNMETLRAEAPAVEDPPAETPHDPVTGEILETAATQNQQAAVSEPPAETAKPVFDINQYRIDTQTGAKDAVKALCAVLKAYPEEERSGVWVSSGGVQILGVLGRHGIGSLRNKFSELGIKMPETV